MKKGNKKRPCVGFFDIGLKEGDILIYKENPKVLVTIINQRQVNYNGEITYLSTVTCKLKHREYNCQPSPFWIVKKNGKILKTMHEEWYNENI